MPKKCGKRQKETTSGSSHDLSNEDPLSQAATVTARGKGTSLFANNMQYLVLKVSSASVVFKPLMLQGYSGYSNLC